ncbi:MAG: polymer-forming cytoskeletal protein [Burkholderiales bacterium]|nr:polymer-forming cytoskeletal protein [Burkholderiales bacterium]
MLKNSFLGRRDEPATPPNTGRASVDSPRYAPQPDAVPLAAVAVSTLNANAANSTAARINAEQKQSSSSSAPTTEPTHAPGTPRLTVGPNITLKGAEINDCDTLVVEGHVEASMDSKTLEILKTGSYQGNVSIDVAEIHGRFDGNLTARKKLIVHATGCVSGVVRYGSLLVSEGGVVSGDIASIDSNGEPQLQRVAGYPSARAGAVPLVASALPAAAAAKAIGGSLATP